MFDLKATFSIPGHFVDRKISKAGTVCIYIYTCMCVYRMIEAPSRGKLSLNKTEYALTTCIKVL